MQKIFIKQFNLRLLVFILAAISVGSLFNSCKTNEDVPNQVELFSYGPMPIARGAELKFIGNLLDKVTSIKLPGNIEISSAQFTSMSSSLITITVPQDAVEGYVTLVFPDGEITTQTPMGFSEPIVLTTFTPATVKAGDELTITGDYLNLIGEVIFTDRIVVKKVDFISQTRQELKVKVPAEAKTGKISISNGALDPIIIYSDAILTVTKPAVTAIDPNPVKVGTLLTVTGTNLDLVKKVVFGGNKNVTTFKTQSATSITLNVPGDAQDGKVAFIPASLDTVMSSSSLIMVNPTVTVSPKNVKNGGIITITGTDLDLVTKVTFADAKDGVIEAGRTATAMTVKVPDAAITGGLVLTTSSNKTVAGGTITIIAPTITSFAPASGKAGASIVITGTDFDVVSKVMFSGDIEGTKTLTGTTSLSVTVPVGAKNGKITLVAINGVKVTTATDFTVLANLPDFTSFSEPKGTPGQILTLNGTKLDLIKELVFPGNVYATAYGSKSDTKIQVYVPANSLRGVGQIKMITYEGEVGLLPGIFIGATDPITAASKIINDFDEVGHDLGWDNWGGASNRMTDANGISGSGAYLQGSKTIDSWAWTWVWGCNHSQLVKQSVNVANYVLKLDLNITAAIPADANNFQFKFGGNDSKWVSLGSYYNVGWITVTFDLVNDLGFSGTIPGSGDWGMICQPKGVALDFTKVNIDNIRFEPK